uniref:Uncharacterized protein n=1 Tax=Physcomitrium patens TaxID=3218 RepID=A0A2K1K334_PHYPA|nr:hypothetical protein PHYPA_012659 [Physcomitrium patens]
MKPALDKLRGIQQTKLQPAPPLSEHNNVAVSKYSSFWTWLRVESMRSSTLFLISEVAPASISLSFPVLGNNLRLNSSARAHRQHPENF